METFDGQYPFSYDCLQKCKGLSKLVMVTIQSMKQEIDEMEKNTFGHAMISVDGEKNLSQQD